MCAVYGAGVDLVVEPVEWSVVYPVYPLAPIGAIRRCRDGFHARLDAEPLGVYPDGDAAAVAIWERFVERAHVEHELASRTHGGYERHR